jgi:uncharacterized protein Yka (UPF0111/DUF47 family)
MEVVRMNRSHWLMPHDLDLLGMLREQTAITLDGLDALVAWTDGDGGAERQVRDCEHRADDAKRELWRALREAFSPPMDAEDLFTLSADLDEVLNGAKDLVREMDVMGMEPDDAMREMSRAVRNGVARLADAFAAFADKDGDPTDCADAAIREQRGLEHRYRSAMSALLEIDIVGEVLGRREAYRRLSRLGDEVLHVADRVWYATVKEA